MATIRSLFPPKTIDLQSHAPAQERKLPALPAYEQNATHAKGKPNENQGRNLVNKFNAANARESVSVHKLTDGKVAQITVREILPGDVDWPGEKPASGAAAAASVKSAPAGAAAAESVKSAPAGTPPASSMKPHYTANILKGDGEGQRTFEYITHDPAQLKAQVTGKAIGSNLGKARKEAQPLPGDKDSSLPHAPSSTSINFNGNLLKVPPGEADLALIKEKLNSANVVILEANLGSPGKDVWPYPKGFFKDTTARVMMFAGGKYGDINKEMEEVKKDIGDRLITDQPVEHGKMAFALKDSSLRQALDS